MHQNELTPDERKLRNQLLERRLASPKALDQAIAASSPGKFSETLVQQGIVEPEQIQALETVSQLSGDGEEKTLLVGTNFNQLIEEEQTVVQPNDQSNDATVLLNAADLEKTVVDEAASETLVSKDVDPGEEKTLILDQQRVASMAQEDAITAETVVDRSSRSPSLASSQSFGTASGSFMSRSAKSMTQEDVENLRRLVRGERSDLIGVNVGGYHIHAKLGEGGMGDVYQATQLSLDREVALKILPPGIAKNEEFIHRFHGEAQTLAKFAHSNIVQIFDVDVHEGVHYITMEQVRGQTLKAMIDSGRELDVGVITNMLKQCVRGLNRALRENIIHRDIKPGNILIDENGEIKIVDFGLALPVQEDGKSKSEGVVGTPLYISPEQGRGDDVDFHTDMYSLGITFYHLIVGEPPFRAPSLIKLIEKHQIEPAKDPAMTKPDLPTALCEIIMKMIEKRPQDRYETYEDLFKAIEKFEIQEGIIQSQTDFLADSLLSMGDRGVRNLALKIGLMTLVTVSLLVLAFGINSLINDAANFALLDVLGDLGTVMLALTYLSIGYVMLVRKGMAKLVGNVKTWMNLHIGCALASFVLVMIHSGNFFRIFSRNQLVWEFKGEQTVFNIALLPALNSFVFIVVIVSGLVGRTIWVDIVRQISAERIKRGNQPIAEDNRVTLTVFSQSIFKFWRILHYPMAIALLLITLAHIITVIYWGGY